jgi:hypothetical protein
LQDATEWLTAYREFWEERYERLDEVLVALQEQDTDRSPDPDPGSDPTGRSTS